MNDYPDDFLKALDFGMKWEVGPFPNGGYISPEEAVKRGDPGGATKWGVSHQAHPELDIEALTFEQARDVVYWPQYWLASGNQESHCSNMPWPLNAVHFDCTMNVGNRKIAKDGTVVLHRRANMILQRALDVDDDGYIGPVTLAAIAAADPVAVAKQAIRQRDMYYATLGHLYTLHGKGWHRRTNDLRKTLGFTSEPAP